MTYDDCQRYIVVLTTFLVCFLTAGTAYGNAAIYYTYWLDHFHDLKSMTSLIGSVNIGLVLILGPLASMLANRYGHRIVVCAGALISSSAMVAGSFASSLLWLLVTHLVCGAGWCLAFIPGAMAVSFYWRAKYHGIIFGFTIAGIGVGQFVSPLLVEALSELYTWRGALLVQGAVNLHLLVCGAVLLPVEGMKKKSDFVELNLLKDLYFINTLVYWLLSHMGISVASVHIAYVMKEALNANYNQSAWMAAIFGISGACARLGHGCISKLPRVNVLLQQLVSMIMMAVCLISMPYVHNYPLMIVVIIITGTGMGSLSLNTILTIDIVGLKSRTAGYGFFAMAAGLGLASGAPIAGLLSDVTDGNYASSLYFGGGVQLLSVLSELGTLMRWKQVKARHIEDLPVTREGTGSEEGDEDEECGEEKEMVMRVTTA